MGSSICIHLLIPSEFVYKARLPQVFRGTIITAKQENSRPHIGSKKLIVMKSAENQGGKRTDATERVVVQTVRKFNLAGSLGVK